MTTTRFKSKSNRDGALHPIRADRDGVANRNILRTGRPGFLHARRELFGVFATLAVVALVLAVLLWMITNYNGPNRDGGATFKKQGDASAIATEKVRP